MCIDETPIPATTDDSESQAGRARQRRRTRAAIVAATERLLASGLTPSVGMVAEAADVSRRTIYQYFPSLEQLLLDASLGLLSADDVEHAVAVSDPGGDPAARVEAMVRAVGAASLRTLPLGRRMLALTAGTTAGPDPGPDPHPRRGYRRVAWIETALEPVRDLLPTGDYERLVSALAMVVGWEGMTVLGDVRGLDEDAQLATAQWAAKALVEAALDQAAPPNG